MMNFSSTSWVQRKIAFPAKKRGFHLITDIIKAEFPEIRQFQVGFLNIFLQHTSASISINENADPTVRPDLETAFNHMCPENLPFEHTYEGPDDMPAHVKSSTIGVQVNIPITDGRLNLGTWQGIYLCEHRDHAGSRTAVTTLWGLPKS